jgi:co-chaperonin GroES (HSP10)
MLVRPYSGEKKTEGGLILTDETSEKIQMTTVCALVVKMGDLCYKDKEKFPNGPWCKEGQFIMYGRYVGNRFQTKYGEHRILNDDEIIGTIKDPKDILHLF